MFFLTGPKVRRHIISLSTGTEATAASFLHRYSIAQLTQPSDDLAKEFA
jgi:hypothetical protein